MAIPASCSPCADYRRGGDGSDKLANVGGITGDLFVEEWGEETQNWIGKRATVSIRTSRATGNDYIMLVPIPEDQPTAAGGWRRLPSALTRGCGGTSRISGRICGSSLARDYSRRENKTALRLLC